MAHHRAAIDGVARGVEHEPAGAGFVGPEAGFEILGEDRCGVGRQRGETEQGCGDGGECDFFGVHFSLSRIRKIIPEEIGLQTSSIYSK